VAAAVALAPAWIAARDVASALSVWHSQLGTAYADLRQASALNPVTDEPYVVAGTIAERRLDWPRARRQFELALGRTDENWYSHMELGLALAKLGNARAARGELERAHVLDPRESVVTEALAELSAHRPIDVRLLDREIIARTPPAAAR
jgi:Flp pilus assembly protein TadD